MKKKLGLIAIISFGSIAIFLGLKFGFDGLVLRSIPVHTLVEAISAFCCIFLGLFFLLVNQYENNESSFNYSSAGLLSIGTFDLFHAIVYDSNTFVWLRAIGSMMGAVGFSLIWFHNWFLRFKVHNFIPLVLFSLSLFLALGSVFYPDVPPVMIEDGIFTSFAKNMHLISGSLFLLASLNYFFMPQESLNERNLFLGSFCFLQFLASLLFSFCTIWTFEWWWWHLLRSMAGIVLIFYVFYLQKKLQKRLELAITLRDEFIAIASHELKTPLSAMKLQTQMLQKYNGQKEKFEWITSMFNKEINRITKVVDELLEISRITSNQLSLNRSETNLGTVVKEAITLLHEEFESTKQELKIEIDDNVTGAWDEFRLSQVVINFLTNAKRYGEGRPIEIKVFQVNNHAFLSVKDHGKGISREDQEKLFQRFERLNRDRNIPGLGIGLFITKKIAEAHGGRIEIKSEPDKGAEFLFIFPMTKISS